MEMNLVNILFLSLFFIGVTEIIKRIRKKTVWVIEDDENEELLLKLKLANTEKVHFVYKRNLKEISLYDLIFNKPDGVIADYFLEGSHRGNEITEYCRRNCIPAILVTGYEGEIFGPSKIIRKEHGGEHISLINSWIERKILAG